MPTTTRTAMGTRTTTVRTMRMTVTQRDALSRCIPIDFSVIRIFPQHGMASLLFVVLSAPDKAARVTAQRVNVRRSFTQRERA
jgi:hypothetical protein